MVRSLKDGPPAQAQHADVCIVGAGAAGIVLAVELLDQGKSVLLLEGGGESIEEDSQDPYRSELVGQRHNGIHEGRFRAKGGTTHRWGGQILELDEVDFAVRPAIPGSGWPITKCELKPYYARALELEGLGQATLDDGEVWGQIGVDPPALDPMDLVFSRWCPEPNFARLHGQTLEKHPALQVWLHTNAVEMIFEGPRFRAIRCRSLNGIEGTFTADEFVFCLGGIESSRFFLQPAASRGPWACNGLLGRHFQDHIVCTGAMLEPKNRELLHSTFDNVFSRRLKYQPKLHLQAETQAQAGTLNVAASIAFISDLDEDLSRLKGNARRALRGHWRESSLEDVLHTLRFSPMLARQVLRYRMHQRVFNPPDAAIGIVVHCEQEPRSESSITLSDERDSLGLYRTRLDWRISDLEIATMRTFIERAIPALAPFGEVIPDPGLLALSPAYKARCGDSNHHMGGMRMSVAPADGLVDTNLKLHGMENGYVCSGAVFPTSGYSNPTHTVLALAVKLADHLSRKQ